MMLQIRSPYFVAGWTDHGECAPIIHYMRNWSEEKVREYCEKKGWEVEKLWE